MSAGLWFICHFISKPTYFRTTFKYHVHYTAVLLCYPDLILMFFLLCYGAINLKFFQYFLSATSNFSKVRFHARSLGTNADIHSINDSVIILPKQSDILQPLSNGDNQNKFGSGGQNAGMSLYKVPPS